MISSTFLLQAGGLVAGPPPFVFSNGLVGYWSLEGNSQESFSSMIGLDYGVTYSTGKIGSGAVFNALATTMIQLPQLTWGTGKVTVACWMKTVAGSAYNEMACSVSQLAASYAGFELRKSITNKLQLVVGNNSGALILGQGYQQCTGTSNLNTGNWIHCLGTYDGTTMKVYVNGVLETAVAYANGMAFSGTVNTRIGNLLLASSGANTFAWSGTLDEVGFWNREFSDTDVQALYNGGAGLTITPIAHPAATLPNGLVAYWAMENNVLDTLGTYNGTATLLTYPAASGKTGFGALFNGTTSKVLVATNPDLSSGKVSVSAWVKTTATGLYKEILSSYYQVSQVAGFEFRMSDQNLAQFVVGNNTTISPGSGYNYAESSSAINSGSWVHLVGTYDGSSIKLYVNGNLESNVSYTGGLAFNANRYTSIGINRPNGTAQYFWSGSIDELGLWNRGLTATEVTQLYNGGTGRNYSALSV